MPDSQLRILYPHAGGRGWDSVTTMVQLAARLLDGQVTQLEGFPSRARKSLGLLPRRRGGGDCLIIAPEPFSLSFLLDLDHVVRGHRRVVAWVIDSFWDDRVPHMARHRGHLDRLFVNDAEVAESWERQTGVETTPLPFGADVLRRGRPGGARPQDLQIVGRQPATWADTEATQRAATAAGIRLAPPVPYVDGDSEANQEGLRRAMTESKFTLAFSNGAAPARYTHPTLEYITGRWTEALTVGSTVAGIAPRCRAADHLLWPGATLELGTIDRDAALPLIREAAEAWRPADAVHNYRMALQRLDWRWRLRELADALGRPTPLLDAELVELRALIDSEVT